MWVDGNRFVGIGLHAERISNGDCFVVNAWLGSTLGNDGTININRCLIECRGIHADSSNRSSVGSNVKREFKS